MRSFPARLLPALICGLAAGNALASEPVPVSMEPPAEKQEPMDLETASFVTADADADLKLKYEEFRTFIGLLAEGDHKSAKWVSALRLYSTAFSVMDKNEDGFVDPDELREGEAEHGK